PLIGGGSPRVNWRVACSGPPLELAWEHHYDIARRKLKSDVYDEFADRFDLPFGCQTVLLDMPGLFYGLATLRSHRDGRSSEEDLAAFAEIAPHVLTAVRLQQSLEHQGASLIAGAFEAMQAPVFVCDRDGRVQALTAAAEAALREPAGLRMVRNKLIASLPDDDRAPQRALGAVLDEANPAPGAAQFWLRAGAAHHGAIRCEVLPLPRTEWNLGFEPRAIVSLCVPAGLDARPRQQLKALLGLTEAEAE